MVCQRKESYRISTANDLPANDLGPQTQFYLPEGILNTNGKNTLAVAVIAIDEAAQLGKVVLEPYAILESAKPQVDLVESPGYSKRN